MKTQKNEYPTIDPKTLFPSPFSEKLKKPP